MNKVVFSVSKAGRSESKLSGVGYIDDKNLYIPSISKNGKHNLPILDGQKLFVARRELLNNYSYKNTVSEVIPKAEAVKFLQYIKYQNTNISSYADYVQACTFIGLDMTLPKNRYPRDFKRWHDMRIDQYHTAKALKDAEERKELYAKFASVAEKYLPLQRNLHDAYIVVIARSPAELIKEGEFLHHCVGRMNYDQKFVREESLIFFIRNAAEPNTPFVTIEYSLSQKKVLQCYGDRDTRPNDSVLEFVNKKWLPFANRQLNKIIKTAQAA